MATYEIRRANQFDLPALELLLARGIEESKGLLPPYDWRHVWHAAVNQIASGLVFVATAIDEAAKRQKICGCLVLDAQPWAWNPDVNVLRSQHFYVLPEERSNKLPDGRLLWEGLREAGQRLSDLASEAAIADGRPPIPLLIEVLHQMGPEARVEAKDELMKRAGLQHVGGTWLYMPRPVAEEKAA
jgi:hypothetical protein